MKPCLPALVTTVCRTAVRLAIRLPLIALFACTLLFLAPGFNSDERSLDLRLSSQSVVALRKAHPGMGNPLTFCSHYLTALAHGDLGDSTTFGAPVAVLVAERWPVTCRSLLGGLCVGWILAAGSAALLILVRSRAASNGAAAVASVLICVPPALIGLIAMLLDGPVEAALAAVVFPRVYQYVGRVLERAAEAPHVVCATGAGVPRGRLFCFACLPPALPELIAVAAASVGSALTALVPLEVICDSPGLGQLAWKATLGRDVSLLLFITLAMATAANLSNAAADSAIEALAKRRA